jgi:hypothetical protein
VGAKPSPIVISKPRPGVHIRGPVGLHAALIGMVRVAEAVPGGRTELAKGAADRSRAFLDKVLSRAEMGAGSPALAEARCGYVPPRVRPRSIAPKTTPGTGLASFRITWSSDPISSRVLS